MLFCIRVNNRGVLLDIYVGNLFSRLACLQSNAQIKSEWVYIVFYTTIWHLCWKSSFHNLLPALESFLFQSNAQMFSASESSIVRANMLQIRKCYKCTYNLSQEWTSRKEVVVDLLGTKCGEIKVRVKLIKLICLVQNTVKSK